MKTIKRILTLALTVILALSVCPKVPLAYEGTREFMEGVLYEVTDEGVIITGYDENLGVSVEIPDTIDGKPVIGIADFAFENSEMFSISFPSSVKLGKGIFYNCRKIVAVHFTENDSFEDYDEKNFTIDDGKTLYFTSSFAKRNNVILPYVENVEFAAAMYLDCKNVSFPSVKTIGEEAFRESQVDTFSFNSAETIDKYAFRDTRFFDCYFGNVKKIGEKAFEGAKGSIYLYGDAPEIAEDAFLNADVKLYYAKGATGWDELNIGAKEFNPSSSNVTFSAWLTENEQPEAPFHTVEVKEGMSLMPSDIPEAPEIEGYALKSFEYDYKPVFTDSAFYARYEVIVWCHVRFIDALTEQLITEFDAPLSSHTDFPPVPEHEGYEFMGWVEEEWYDPNYPHGSMSKQFVVQGDRMYYCTYKELKYAVDFIDSLVPYEDGVNLSDTDALIAERMVKYGQDLAPEDFPTPPEHFGYTFTGWSDDAKNIRGDRLIFALYTPNGLSIGDANTDGTINTSDAVQILKASAGMLTLTDAQRMCADTNRDGVVNTSDAVQILRYAAGMITEF